MNLIKNYYIIVYENILIKGDDDRVKNEKELVDAGVLEVGQARSSYTAYDVLASWSDNADSMSYGDYILITNSPSIFLPNLIHTELGLPWTSSDHGYNNQLDIGFRYNAITFSDKKYLNAFDEIKSYINSHSESSHMYSRIDVIEHDWRNDKINHLVSDKDVHGVLNQLSQLRAKQIKKEKAEDRKKKANEEVQSIAKTITKMSDENKRKLLKLILK